MIMNANLSNRSILLFFLLDPLIPNSSKSPLYCMKDRVLESIFLEPVTEEELNTLISKL